jgi:oxygen-independent coproporphyrinogen-3 oxidase
MLTRTLERLGWNMPSLEDQKRFDPRIVFEAGLRHHHIANTAYPIHHQTTMRPYRAPRDQAESTALAAWQSADRLGLYVHVPFCAARCKYCEYAVVEHNERDAQSAYFDALLHEIEMYRDRLHTKTRTLIGFDIGGGTPSFVQVDHIRRIVEAIRASFQFGPDMTISIETTPIIADREPAKMHAFKEMGIDRISMGVQTTHLKLARSLGREYEGMTMLERAVHNIRDAGFRRFNIDLMYGFADQSPEAWRNTVQQTLTLEPEYITLYQMRYKGTRIQSRAALVTRDRVNHLRHIARDLLLTAGYMGTPGKNTYSRVPGDEGTSDYLTERVIKGTPYLGLGLAAQSLSQYTLSYNMGAASKTLSPYLRAIDAQRLPIQDLYHLDLGAAMGKMIAVSFYFGQIHREHFAEKFGVRLEEQFADEVAFVLENGLMEQVGPYLRLTDKGADHFNGIVALFYAGSVKDYLVRLGSSFAAPVSQEQLKEAA